MTEYWKSNPRKFCDYCKCWFADNRPSIEFHQAGKKHKENVAKKLKDIGQRGKEDYDNSLMVEDYMKKMEQAALKAYKNDIGHNPDMTGSTIASIAKEKNADIVLKGEQTKPPPPVSDSKWFEAKSSEGHSYYFHTETKETKWETPSDGFISIENQKMLRENKKAAKKKKKSHSKKEEKASTSSVPAVVATTRTVPTTVSEERVVASAPASPERSAHGYNSWITVEKPVMPDFQLPTVPGAEEYNEEDYYASLPKETPHQFTQKTVTLGETSTGTGFKRKKNSQVSKKNARIRNDDL